MRDWRPVRGLLYRLLDPKRADDARGQLVAFAGQDHGTNEEAWRAALATMLRGDIADALTELGLLDDRVSGWMRQRQNSPTSLRFEPELARALGVSRRHIYLPDRVRSYADPRLTFARDVAHVTGGHVETRPSGDGAEMVLDDQRTVIRGDERALREQAFAALCRWADAHAAGRRFVVDTSWVAYLLDAPQIAAFQRYRPRPLRAFDPARTARAEAWLDELGLVLPPSANLTDGSVAEIVTEWLLDVKCGAMLENPYGMEIWRAFQQLRIAELPPTPPGSIHDDEMDYGAVIDIANDLLARGRSEMRLVGVARGESMPPPPVLVIAVPLDRVAPLAAAGIVRFGAASADPSAPRTIARHALGARPGATPSDFVPAARQWIGDGESVDDPGDYRRVVEELCAIAGLTAKFVSSSETKPTRTLTLALGRQTFVAAVSARGWIDAPPLLACLNEIAAAADKKRRFHEFRDPSWGQELGIVFASDAEMEQLRAHGFAR